MSRYCSDLQSAVLVLSSAALVLAGFALIAYVASASRRDLGDRVDKLLTGLGRPASGRDPAARRAPSIFRAPGRLPADRDTAAFARLLHVSPAHAAATFLATRLVLASLATAGLVLLEARARQSLSLGPMLMAAGPGIAIGWFVPPLLMRKVAAGRLRHIQSDLPEAVELLIIGVEAGLTLEDALERVFTEMQRSRSPIAEELALTLADMKILPSRTQALANMAQRIDLPSARSVVTTLSQTLHYGTPLAQALHVVAAELRNDALLHLEERVNKLTVLLTLPMVLFILPSILLVVGGPAALRLIENFSH